MYIYFLFSSMQLCYEINHIIRPMQNCLHALEMHVRAFSYVLYYLIEFGTEREGNILL